MLNMNGNEGFPHWNPFLDLSASDGMLQGPYASLRMAAYPGSQAAGSMDLAYGQSQPRAPPSGGAGYHYGIQSRANGHFGVTQSCHRPATHFSVAESFNSGNPSTEGEQLKATRLL